MSRPFCIFSFSQYSRQRSWHNFCSTIITAEAPQQSSPPCIFHTPLLLLLGGLLGKADASHLALRPLLTHSLAVRMLSKVVKKPQWSSLWSPCMCSQSLLLHLLVKQFDRLPGQLFESGRSLWRVAWTVLADISWAWASFMTLSFWSFCTSAAISALEVFGVRFLWSAAAAAAVFYYFIFL